MKDIVEKIKFSKNSFKNFILESSYDDDEEDACSLLADIVHSAKEKNPPIWDDTGDWEANDAFDYWESAFGEFDDVKDFISDYADGKCVAGWSTEESFEATEKLIPKKMISIMKASKPYIPYKKRSNKMEVWETKEYGFDVTVLKFINYNNHSGTDFAEFWYMIAIED